MVSRKPVASETHSATLDSSRSSGPEDAVHTSANDGLPTYPAPQSVLDGPRQDAGDFGIGGLTLNSNSNHSIPHQNTGSSTNPFRHVTPAASGSATPSIPNNGPSFWDESHTALPEDSHDDSPFSTSTSTPPLLDDLSDQEEAHGGPVAAPDLLSQHEPRPILSAAKGKAPLLDAGIPTLDISPTQSASRPEVETPRTKARKQRNEVYQIKHIRWHDVNAIDNPRSSPILTQNANGPCPLLALVNALSLSTPAELITPFIDTLRTREQISLGLLLDAVFEELMSDRRGGHLPDLPDVGDLYTFLVTLHTGMNVNPRFVTDTFSQDESMGTFEATREMKLYSTFQIPLIHGWIPHQNELAHQAFTRTAQTYEDAQNVQFQEEDLERKLQTSEITAEEQQLLGDLKTIGQFFTYWPTQLTAHGLDVMKRGVKPGHIAILFRNDHFSMLYREPRSQRLMTLVTDAGYATHDEIVWESLVDINGANGEWFSGDFRSVSHENPVGRDACDDEDGWTTVESRRGQKDRALPEAVVQGQFRHETGNDAALSGPSNDQLHPSLLGPDSSTRAGSQKARSASEQEDLDMALALQLQEEEEERLREQDTNRRRAHENKMSRDFIERQSSSTGAGSSSTNGVQIPVRRSGHNQAPTTHRPESGDDAPPPYEQAASSQPYHPPRGHPSSESAPRQNSAYAQQAAAMGQLASDPSSRRRMSARQSLAANQMGPNRPPILQPRRLGRIETGMNSSNAGRDMEKCNVM